MPWTEEPGGLQSKRSQRVNWACFVKYHHRVFSSVSQKEVWHFSKLFSNSISRSYQESDPLSEQVGTVTSDFQAYAHIYLDFWFAPGGGFWVLAFGPDFPVCLDLRLFACPLTCDLPHPQLPDLFLTSSNSISLKTCAITGRMVISLVLVL